MFSILFSTIIIFIYFQFFFNIFHKVTSLKINIRDFLYIYFRSHFFNLIPFLGFVYKGIKFKSFKMKYSEYIYSYLFITWIFAIIFPVYFFIEAFLLFLFFENEYLLYLSCFMISFSIITFLVIFFLSKFFFHFKFKSRLLVLLKSILNYININFKRKMFLYVSSIVYLYTFWTL